ncbi:hypothetical protein AGABI1DRAFT_104370 [Agaricus bisporus var. burnettii JB137-S8]|uniref:Uncharacterized protein n=1 Tax=Agaricus bisporus var. burnettii (strain JB137-S8 / ATCC MYA-4627 / FGSC 10392) TaxID=597362 RepID=K5Y349_AGABU|nr:uncharacterized protein AGABI1DRAFT_104370 [Agaricus bisporus var. burnettii JB137-S8]EKM82345.1 hypothetical protein AGABI1DRAFT_104370 [Agaricus bisporus var. burnettii JB137-S8]
MSSPNSAPSPRTEGNSAASIKSHHDQHLIHAKHKKRLFRISLFTFILLEVGYIVLAAVCLARPVPLRIPLDLSDSEVKGGFTVVVVVWQTLAIVSGAYMANDVYEEEPGATKPNHHTRLTVTAVVDFIDHRVTHLIRGRATKTFILAFLASISFFALNSLAPGAISAATTLIDSPITLPIGRLLSHATADDTQEVFTAQGRANLILRLEMIEHSPFGFNLESNMLTAVPRVDLASFNGTIEYNSDVVEFHHDCHWEAPQFFNTSGDGVIVSAADQQWFGATVGTGPINLGSSVGPLSLTTFPIMEAVGTSAFIFSGGNTSIPITQSNPPTPFAIDLGSLPTTFSASGAGVDIKSNSLYAPLSSVLICDASPEISGGRIRITNDGTLKVIASGQTPIGNIPRSAANLIFTNAFQVALLETETLAKVNAVNNVASIMFMANSSTVDWNTARNIRPLDLPSINKNMDTFMLSAAKAYIDGYRKNGTSVIVEFDSETVSAMGQKEELALSTSEGIFISTIVVFAIVTVLLLLLLFLRRLEKDRELETPESPRGGECEKLDYQ